ncbi:CpaD family pilus assembly lipoprotein [Robbsia andropogonis]|uniref:CpaD family pilus assembly lipoprotein n=1 Tax=Robbsia andropogonis TaxID=28092 RepID=UPI003D1B28AC
MKTPPYIDSQTRRGRSRRARLSILAALLVCGCAEPPLGMRDVDVIGYDGKHAVAPDCSQLSEDSVVFGGTTPRPKMAWGCATYTNLAAQLAQPSDLVAPHALTPADAAVAASAVHRYQNGAVMPLKDNNSVKPGGS